MSVADEVDELALESLYEQLEEMDPSTFETKAGSILHGLGFDQKMMAKPTKVRQILSLCHSLDLHFCL